MRWAALLVLAGCATSNTVQCEFGVCPEGRVCDEVNSVCAFPEQLTECVGMADGMDCAIGGKATGICKQNICVTARCGDHLPGAPESPPEVCDGNVPARGTCIDYAYDYGVLGCTDTCTADTTSCHQLGWYYRLFPGTGGISAIWEDGQQLWVGGNLGLWHYNGTSWESGAGGITTWVHGIWGSNGQLFVAAQVGSDGLLARFDGTTWQKTMVTGSPMWGVYGLSANDVVAVGELGAIRRWNGSTWQSTPASPNTSINLRKVWGTGSTLVVLGENRPATNQPATIGYVYAFNGASWSTIKNGVSNEIYTGVWGASATDYFIVGYTVNLTLPFEGLIYSSGSLTIDASVGPPLRDIQARSSNEIYLSGDQGTIFVYDRQSYSRMDVPSSAQLHALHVTADKVYAAQTADTFLELDSAIWSRASDAVAPTSVFDVWAANLKDNVYAVGGGCQIYRYDSQWHAEQLNAVGILPECPTLFSWFESVWGPDSNNAYAGGPYGFFYKRASDGSWNLQPIPFANGAPKWIRTIWGTSATDVFLGGGLGDGTEAGLAHFNGSTWDDWSSQITAYTKGINKVWGFGPSDVYLLGSGGAILHYNGATIAPMTSATTNDLHGIWGSGPSDIFVVGDQGTILHYDGTTWSPMAVPEGITTPTKANLQAVDGTGPDNVFAAGARTLLHWDGTQWAPIQRPDGDPVRRIRVFGAQLWMAGDFGFAPRLIGKLLP